MKQVVRGALGIAGLVAHLGVAEACGGCAYPPPDAGPREAVPVIVTDHRIAVAVHPAETVLWDQIRWSGRSDEFVWLLPVRGAVQVSVGSGEFLDELDAWTAPRVISPAVSCDARAGGSTVRTAERPSGSALLVPDELESAATVYHAATVGPYEFTTIGGNDPEAIRAWLVTHGYVIHPALAEEIAHYTALRMDFLAARLRPEEGVRSMRPLRVTFRGAPVLPLRMMRAGAADRTGLAVFVIAAGRYAPMNFDEGTLDGRDLHWDFSTAETNYAEVFSRAVEANGGGRWITEAAGPVDATAFSEAARADWSVAREGVGAGVWVTRLRTSLSRDAMARELQLGAHEGAAVNRALPAGTWSNAPRNYCAPLSGSGDAGRASSSRQVFAPRGGCAVRPGHATVGGLAWLAVALFASRRRVRRS